MTKKQQLTTKKQLLLQCEHKHEEKQFKQENKIGKRFKKAETFDLELAGGQGSETLCFCSSF